MDILEKKLKALKDREIQLIDELIKIEKDIYNTWSNDDTHCPINNEDWTDAHQEYLEMQWEKRDLNDRYIALQQEFFDLINSNKTPKTAKEYYEYKKSDEKYTEYLKKNHLNGF